MNSDKNIGIITGLPRCRTAWLSELFTIYGFSFAYHEAEVGCEDDEQWRDKLLNNPEKHIIDCNPGFFLTYDYKLALFPNAKIIIVSRNDEESFTSWKKAFQGPFKIPDKDAELTWAALKNGRDNLRIERKDVLEIDYKDLDNETTYLKMGVHLFGGDFPSDLRRFAELRKKIIVQNAEHMAAIYN